MQEKSVDFFNFDPLCGLKVGDDCNFSNLLNYNNLRNGDVNAFSSKLATFYIYFNYFSNIAMNLIKYDFESIPTDYIQKALYQDGKLAFFTEEKIGGSKEKIAASTFTDDCVYDHYGRLKKITLFNSLPFTADTLKNITIENDFKILWSNSTRIPLMQVVYYFCQKILELQTAVDNNVLNNSLPVAVECTNDQILALNNIFKNIQNQNRFLYFKKDHNARAEDLFKALDINVEFKSDKMLEVINYYKGEFFTMLGINNTPFEKKERLLRDEVKSNNQILNLTLDSYFQTQKACVDEINRYFNTDFKISLNTEIEKEVEKQDEMLLKEGD